ncbi:hypothetical protein LTSEMIS_6009 [Salmonella enterica subsp. enterica serovar Mississippi str. A4-633]|nr:hypothetical protein LTSEMIS_6009 [Salmonella enterica subsp. enterica serovar Mississippi str. A4-633]
MNEIRGLLFTNFFFFFPEKNRGIELSFLKKTEVLSEKFYSV